MKKITDAGFKYDPSFDTDISKRFARIRRQQAEQAKRTKEIEAEQVQKLAGRIKPNRRTA